MVRPTWRCDRLLPGRRRAAAVIVFLVSAGGVAGLSLAYRGQSQPGRLDTSLQDHLSAATAGADAIMRALVVLGDWQVVAVLALVLTLVAARTGGYYLAVFACSSTAIATVVSELVLKPLVGRRLDGDLAFPSGHSTGVAVLAFVVAITMVASGRARASVQAVVIVGAVVVVAAVAIALTALGDHYGTDTIGGALVAVAITSLVALVLDAGVRPRLGS